MKKYRNNSGFTLTELLIAVLVLAFGVVPIMSNFAQSGRMNQRAKINMNGTNMAEDIMEGISAYSATDVINMFESEDDLIGKILANNFSSYDSHGDADSSWSQKYVATRASFDTSQMAVGTDRQYSKKVVSGNSVDVKKSSDGNYYFVVNNLVQGNNRYNLRLTLSTGKYAKTENGNIFKRKLKDKTNNVNGEEMSQIIQMTAPYDSVFRISSSDFDNLISEIQKKGNPSSMPNTIDAFKAAIKDDVDRTINLTIKNDGTATDPKYQVLVSSSYKLSDAKCTAYGIATSDNIMTTITPKNISAMGDKKLPRSVYLFYEASPGSYFTARDHFKIENETAEPITVYVIRTLNVGSEFDRSKNVNMMDSIDAALSNVVGSANETNYRAIASVKSAGNFNTKFVSNICLDLSKQFDSQLDDITAQDGFLPSRLDFSYHDYFGTDWTGHVKGLTPGTPKDDICYFDGYKLENKDYVYTAYLEVYDAKTKRQVAVFDGGLVE